MKTGGGPGCDALRINCVDPDYKDAQSMPLAVALIVLVVGSLVFHFLSPDSKG